MADKKNSLVESMHNPSLVAGKVAASTQHFLDIDEIKDGVIVLKDKTQRGVLMVSSINFSLKAAEEQEGIIFSYQEFLNSLDFPIQILIQSRMLEIDDYVDKLNQHAMKQTNELLRIQTAEYAEYVKELVEMAQIMSKDFYVIVPFSGLAKTEGSKKKEFMNALKPAKKVVISEKDFESKRLQLLQRVEHIKSGLESLGLRVAPLETQELIELLYNTYNPSVFEQEKLAPVEDLEIK